MNRLSIASIALVACGARTLVATPPSVGLVRYPSSLLALTHVRVFDGTLTPARPDQTVVLDHGRIANVGPAASTVVPPGATVIDLAGHSVFPGLVGMHDHLFYIDVAFPTELHGRVLPFLPEIGYSGPRLYLAGGVTTMRTTGSVEPYADLRLKRLIDEGIVPGPDLDVTAPYMDGPSGDFPQMSELRSPDDAERFVEYWAAAGATSFKAYTHLTRDVLRAAINAAHRHHLKVTGHLCAVTYMEATELGIDNLEHGFFTSTDFGAMKQPDVCPPDADEHTPLLDLDPAGAEARGLIRALVEHHVALTSTLPVFEDFLPGRHPDPRGLAVLAPPLLDAYRAKRTKVDATSNDAAIQQFRTELVLERAFVAAGGLLLAGADPTGLGGVLPGFGDQRGIELLVEAGFSAVEAIHVATYNGAQYLDRGAQIGTIEPGKQADLVVVRGDLNARIRDVENVEIVFKRGIGYDPHALVDSVRGKVGLY